MQRSSAFCATLDREPCPVPVPETDALLSRRGTDMPRSRARKGDGFELPVREHRAMAPSHGFAAASHREAALREAPASHDDRAFRGAAGFREARRRHAVHPSRNAVLRRRAFANGKIPAARLGRHSVEFRLVREENGNALPGDRARRSRPGARQPLGRSEGAVAGPPSMRRAAMRAAAVKCRTAAVDGGTSWSPSGNPIWSVAISLAAT